MAKKRRETHLWQVDPALFKPLRRAGFVERRILSPIRTLAGPMLIIATFAYPLVLVMLGVVYGALVFWSSLACSVVLIWLVLKKTGYSRNFDSWDISYRKFLAVLAGFPSVLGFYVLLLYTPLKVWTVPLLGMVLFVLFMLGIRIKARG